MFSVKKAMLWTSAAAALLSCFLWFQAISRPVVPSLPVSPPAAVPVPPPEPEMTVVAVGDVMLARKLNRLMAANGVSYPFAATAAVLEGADITFANLESPISDRGEKLPGKGIWFRAEPQNAAALEMAGFDILSLANNHALDYQDAAFLQTLSILDGLQIAHAGGGADIAAASAPVIMEKQGIRAAFLAYSEMADIVWSRQQPRQLQATADRPGIAPLVTSAVIADIQKVRSQADLVFVSLHWGTEYQHLPSARQRELAHQLIDAGADVIIGHHPHCIQGIETYRQGLIAYSLGNFVFDQNQNEDTKSGLLLQLICSRQGWLSAAVRPVYINDGQPTVAGGDAAVRILSQLREISAELGSDLTIANHKIELRRRLILEEATTLQGEHF